MARYTSGNTPPLGQWGNVPIFLTTIVTAALVVGLLVTALLTASGSPLLSALVFDMPLVPSWSLWRLVTYVVVTDINFFTPFGIFFFYWMSMGLETHLGRAALARLLTLLVLVVPALAAAWWFGFGHPSSTYQWGNYLFTSSLLVAFATLYPRTEAFGWVPFKWVAFACIVCGSLMLLARGSVVELSELWGSCAVAFAFVRHALEAEYDDYESPLARLQLWFRRRRFRVVKPAPRPRPAAVGASSPADELDRLLDKIAKSGIDSLTPAERTRLEKAREALLRKERS
jgi:hypothetical protein